MEEISTYKWMIRVKTSSCMPFAVVQESLQKMKWNVVLDTVTSGAVFIYYHTL